VITLLYDKTFHMTQVQEQGTSQVNEQDIEFLRRQQQAYQQQI
jgi:hypothetical protein